MMPLVGCRPKRPSLKSPLSLNRSETMPATEITVTSAGKVADKELLIPTGQEGAYFAHIQDWLSAQLKAKKAVRDVSTQVLVKGIKQWAAYEQKSGAKKLRTVFKIT